ncbi:zinc finger, CCHC-type containing protein [Tanacetum coccineum]
MWRWILLEGVQANCKLDREGKIEINAICVLPYFHRQDQVSPQDKEKVLADLPLGCKPLGCKWILKKLKVNGTIEKFKARLVSQGLRQKSGIDYFDTYAPVARISTIKLLIVMALIHNLIIHQMDVKTAFLNGELDDEVYINQPQGFIMLGNENKLCKLVKSLYGLKHAPKQWYTSNPGTQHWHGIQRVLKYLKKTIDYRLTYTGYPSVLESYTDASWISNTKDNSSSSGWVFLLGDGATSYASKNQTCITGSIMESEFVALAVTGKEAQWLKNFLLEIPLWSKPIAPISIRCDNATTFQMYNGKSRHLGVRHSMIRELITNEVISIEFVRSQQNLVDHLTKRLARDLVIKSAEGIGLKGLKHMYLHIIPMMRLEPAKKQDEVFTSQWSISLKREHELWLLQHYELDMDT